MISKYGGMQPANIQGYFSFIFHTFPKTNEYPIKHTLLS